MPHKEPRPYVEPKVHIPIDPRRAIRLSNRQLCQLRAFATAPQGTINLEQLASFNQNTCGANRRREWITEKRKGHAVGITHEGLEVLRAFENADFLRKVASANFSCYLKLEPPQGLVHALKKNRLEVVRKPAAA